MRAPLPDRCHSPLATRHLPLAACRSPLATITVVFVGRYATLFSRDVSVGRYPLPYRDPFPWEDCERERERECKRTVP